MPLLIFLIFVVIFNFQKYFKKWALHEEVKRDFCYDTFQIGKYLNNLPKDIKKYIIFEKLPSLSFPFHLCIIKFVTYKRSECNYITLQDIEKIDLKSKSIIILPTNDSLLIKKLLSTFSYFDAEKRNNFYVLSKF
jgi:hypothetical protein